MPSKVQRRDAIIIGSGQGGNPLSQAIAKRGEHVLLIESGDLGGTCINTGCTPTKTMVASAQVAYYAREGKRWGVSADNVSIDMSVVLKRKQERVLAGRTGWEKSFNQPGSPDLIRGRARFTGPNEVEVNCEAFASDRIFIDTGSAPTIPPIKGLDRTPYLTNVSVMELTSVPAHLLVLGGGYVGLEFAQMFRRFGSQVSVIQGSDQILPHEDADIAKELQKALEAEGISFHLNAKATGVEQAGDQVTVSLATESGDKKVSGSHLLVAVGRTPQTRDLDLPKAGVRTDNRGNVIVNDRLETSAPGIWAIGDVTGGPAFTHISYNDFQIIFGNVYEGKQLSTKTRIVPYAVFTDPNLGRIGMTEKEARASGRKLKIGNIPMTKVARALERGETAGMMKLVVDADTDRVMGAAILATEGGEVVQIFSALILAEKPYTLLKGAIYIHPTIAEGFFGLLESVKPVD